MTGRSLLYAGIAACFPLFLSCTRNYSHENFDPNHIHASTVISDTVVTPDGYTKLAEAKGDLDGDRIPETAIVIGKGKKKEREIRIFHYLNKKWELWHTSVGAVLPGARNTIENDPIMHISIENQLLKIWHNKPLTGDGRISFTHDYRYKDQKWELVFVKTNSMVYENESTYYGECEYNLLTGELDYVRKTEKYIDGEGNKIVDTIKKEFALMPNKLPLMDGFVPGEHTMKEINEVYY